MSEVDIIFQHLKAENESLKAKIEEMESQQRDSDNAGCVSFILIVVLFIFLMVSLN